MLRIRIRKTLRRRLPLLLALAAVSFSIIVPAPAAQARSGDITIETGKGEAFEVKHNLFGQRSFAVQDRLGNKIANEKGLFGNSKVEVGLLGNEYERKKNIFGSKSIKASDMFGDKIESKKSWFGLGRRKTTINLSGTTGLINQALAKRKDAESPSLTGRTDLDAPADITNAFPSSVDVNAPQP